MTTRIVNGQPVEVADCKRCGAAVSMVDPLFHAERYGHDAEWDEHEAGEHADFVDMDCPQCAAEWAEIGGKA